MFDYEYYDDISEELLKLEEYKRILKEDLSRIYIFKYETNSPKL